MPGSQNDRQLPTTVGPNDHRPPAPEPVALGGSWTGRPSAAKRLDLENLWPRQHEVSLLRALVGPPSEAAGHWREWVEQRGFEQLDLRSRQLIAACYHRRQRLAARPDEIDLLKNAYLFTWAHNRRLFLRIRPVLVQLEELGCPALVLKGAALATDYYQDLGARNMSDVDLLVPQDQFARVVSSLTSSRWRPIHYHPELFDTRFCHALPLIDGQGGSLDLHCHVLASSCESGADEEFWQAAVPTCFEQHSLLTLSATDHLLHTCAHGIWWVQDPPLRWVVDAASLLESSAIDWPRLLRLAELRGVSLRVGRALALLQELGLDVPGATVEQLISDAGRLEQLKLKMATTSSRGRPLQLLAEHWMLYRRGVRGRHEMAKLAAIPGYLRFSTQTPSLTGVPFEVAKKGLRSVAYRFGRYKYWNTD